jgi:O-antigen ligase
MSNVNRPDRLRTIGATILVLILVLTGSYVRVRSVDESETVDWLIIAQLGLCLLGGAVGVLLMRKYAGAGTGAKLLIGYLTAVLLSVVVSPYIQLAAGYWMLLAGASLLCIGLVMSSPDEESLRRLEFMILGTLAFMLVKDSILDWFILEAPDTEDGYRLGESVTSANQVGMMAAIAFCMSFITPLEEKGGRFRRIVVKSLLLAIIVLTRSRVALFGAVLGMAARLWFRQRPSAESRSYLLLAGIPCWVGSLVLLAAITWTMGLQPVTGMVDFVNRNEDSATLMSVTGRTEIWSYAIQRVFDGAHSILLGHGYGVSKFVLNENNWAASFFAFHSHNTVLEALLSTGMIGLLPFLLWCGYSLKWVARFSQLREIFPAP